MVGEAHCYVGRCPCLFLGGVHGEDPEKVFKIRELAAWVIQTQSVKSLRVTGSVVPPDVRERVEDSLESRPFPHYEASPVDPEFLIRINEDGSRTVGRFVKCQFESFGPLPEGFKFDQDEENAR